MCWEAGRQPHRRSRSIETLGPGGDAREAYRMQLERIGSMDRNSDTGRSAATTYTGTLFFTAVSTCAIDMQQDSLTRTSVLHGRVARSSVRSELTWAVKLCSKASTPRRVSVSVPPADAPAGGTSQRRPSLPSPLKLATTADRPHLPLQVRHARPRTLCIRAIAGIAYFLRGRWHRFVLLLQKPSGEPCQRLSIA